MGITIEQPGLATTYGQLAHLAGVSQAERRRAEIAEQQAEQRDQRIDQAQQAALDRSARREMQQFDAQMKVETEKRAHLWEIEKMQMRSQTDFQMEEEQRITRQKEYDAAIRAVQQSIDKGQIDADSEQTKNLLLSLKIKKETGWSPSLAEMRERTEKTLTPQQQLQQMMADALRNKSEPPSELPGRGVASGRQQEAEKAYQKYISKLTEQEDVLPYEAMAFTKESSKPTVLPHLSKEQFFEMWYPDVVEEATNRVYNPVATREDPLNLGL